MAKAKAVDNKTVDQTDAYGIAVTASAYNQEAGSLCFISKRDGGDKEFATLSMQIFGLPKNKRKDMTGRKFLIRFDEVIDPIK